MSILTLFRFVFAGISNLGSEITLTSLIILCSCNDSSFSGAGVVILFSVLFSSIGSTAGRTVALKKKQKEFAKNRCANESSWQFQFMHVTKKSLPPGNSCTIKTKADKKKHEATAECFRSDTSDVFEGLIVS